MSSNIAKMQIENRGKIEKDLINCISKMRIEILQKKQKNTEQDLKIKELNLIIELEDLKQWIINNLNEDELINFFVNKKNIKELSVIVIKEKDLYCISLGTKKLGKFFADELFSTFIVKFGVDNLKDIPIFEILLYYKLKDEFHGHGSIDPNPW